MISDKVWIVLLLTVSFMLIGSHLGPIIPVTFSLAEGSSMFPSIVNGDMLVCVSKYIAPIHPGDIAVYKKRGEFVVHRVLAIKGDKVLFRGDNNMIPDDPVPMSNVYFKVVMVLPTYVWVPLIGVALSSYGVFLIMKRRESESSQSDEAEMYSLSVIVYFIGIAGIVILLSINTISTTPLRFVKPNPLPTIEVVEIKKDTIIVHFTNELHGSVSCDAVIDKRLIPLNCANKGKTVVVDTSSLRDVCSTALCVVHVTINYNVETPYNVVVHYSFSTAVRR